MMASAIAMLCIGLGAISGCEQETPPTTASSPSAPSSASSPSGIDKLERLPDRLQEAVTHRRQYVPRIELDPWFKLDMSTEDLVELLHRERPRVDTVVAASRSLTGTPPRVEAYGELDTSRDEHLDGVRARVLNNVRLLQADAVLRWQEGDAPAAAERLAACLRVGAFMAQGETFANTLSNLDSVSITTVFELAALADAGLIDRLPDAARMELRNLLEHVTENAAPPDTRVRRELARLTEALVPSAGPARGGD